MLKSTNIAVFFFLLINEEDDANEEASRKADQVAYIHPNNTLQSDGLTYYIYNVLDSPYHPIFYCFKSEAQADWSWDILGDRIGR